MCLVPCAPAPRLVGHSRDAHRPAHAWRAYFGASQAHPELHLAQPTLTLRLPSPATPHRCVMGRGMGMGMGRGGIFSAYHESWRKHPMLNPRYRDMFPGFGYAVIIFGTYLVGEFAYNRFISKPSGGHGHH